MPNLPTHRRQHLKQLAAISASLSVASFAQAQDLTQAHLKSRGLSEQGITVDLPPLSDNSNAIPMQLALQAPQGRRIQSLDIVAPENPNPLVLRLKLQQPLTRYRLNTRIRLAMTQEVWVIATLDNGQQLGKASPIIVTATACFDET
ncbi:COG5501 Predicted secreted protein [Burkholderiaceae bacterium]